MWFQWRLPQEYRGSWSWDYRDVPNWGKRVGPLNPLIKQSLAPSARLEGDNLGRGNFLWSRARPDEGHSREAIMVYCLSCPGMDTSPKEGMRAEHQSFHHGSVLIKSLPAHLLSPVNLKRIKLLKMESIILRHIF